MPKLEEDLKLAESLIEETEKYNSYYWQFYRMWAFTTINMKEELDFFDLENKRCLIIEGSSDHVFEIFLKKPKKIIGVDTNPLTEHYFYLKLAAFEILKHPEDFLKFFRWYDYPKFCDNNKHAFDKDIFEEISKHIIGDSRYFWEELFRKYEPIQIRTKLFNAKDEENNRALYKALTYLNPENYEYIRENKTSLNFEFMNTDIRNLRETLDEEIDFMTLSNLIIYAHSMYPEESIQSFYHLILSLSQKLSATGQIMAGYLYDIENEEDFRDIYKKSLRDKVFTSPHFMYHYVQRMVDLHRGTTNTQKDACLIYRK